jgi:hypothetical protein
MRGIKHTIIPSPGNVLDWDRYLYVRNNPLKYNDPSGHNPECGPDGIYCDQNATFEERYGITFSGTWDDEDRQGVIAGVEAVARKFALIFKTSNLAFAWGRVFGYMKFQMGGCDLCAEGDVGGYTYGAHEIRFSGMSDRSDMRRRNHVVHEIGHAFIWTQYYRYGFDVYSELGKWRTGHPGYPDRPSMVQKVPRDPIMALQANKTCLNGNKALTVQMPKNSPTSSWGGLLIHGKQTIRDP